MNHFPNDIEINAGVIMNELISHPYHLRPRNFRVGLSELTGYLGRGLAHDLKCAYDGKLVQFAAVELFASQCGGKTLRLPQEMGSGQKWACIVALSERTGSPIAAPHRQWASCNVPVNDRREATEGQVLIQHTTSDIPTGQVLEYVNRLSRGAG